MIPSGSSGSGVVTPKKPAPVPILVKRPWAADIAEIRALGAPGLPVSEAYPFLWFLANIIDHCIEQRGNRESVRRPSCETRKADGRSILRHRFFGGPHGRRRQRSR